jgi:hypothetical protein
MSTLSRRDALAVGVGALLVSATQAASSEGVILTVEGAIAGPARTFDRTALEKLGMHEIRTATPWHDGVVAFAGPRLDELMREVGASGTMIAAVALNDYEAELPIEDFAAHGPILAMTMNGRPMSVRDKGPLFIIYPYSSSDELSNEKYYSRSVWQLTSIVVK